jgi:hypothetical protein
MRYLPQMPSTVIMVNTSLTRKIEEISHWKAYI